MLLFFGIHESSISSLKMKSLKTTLKFRSAPQAVRPADSTCGALPLHFFVVFLCFLFKGGLRFVISTMESTDLLFEEIFFFCLDIKETKNQASIFLKIIGRISLSQPQPLMLRTQLGGHSLLPKLKSLP